MLNRNEIQKLIRLLKELEKLESPEITEPIVIKPGQTYNEALGDYAMRVEAEIHYLNQEIDELMRRI